MSFLRKFNEKSGKKPFKNFRNRDQEKPRWYTVDDALDQNGCMSYEKLLNLTDRIGHLECDFEMYSGQLSFGEITFSVQIIGSLSLEDQTWTWGWANKEMGAPNHLFNDAWDLKEIGEKKDIPTFYDASFEVPQHFEHVIGMVACGLFKSKSYYIISNGGELLVLNLYSDRFKSIIANDFQKMSKAILSLTNSVDIHHRRAIFCYFVDRSFEINEFEDAIEGSKNDYILRAEFDHNDRLVNLLSNR